MDEEIYIKIKPFIQKDMESFFNDAQNTLNNKGLFKTQTVFHQHNGVDGPQVNFSDLSNMPLTTLGDLITFSNKPVRLPVGTDGQILSANSTETTGLEWINAGRGTDFLFGNGSDGTVTFNGSSTILGMVPVANVYTLTRDIFCINITINSSVFLTGPYRVFYTGTLTNAGTISNNGVSGGAGGAAPTQVGDGSGSGGSAGTASGVSNGTIKGALTGGAGGEGGTAGNGNNGTNGTNETYGGISNSGIAGGAGGAGGAVINPPTTGGTGGTGGTTTIITKWSSVPIIVSPYVGANFFGVSGSSAGGGGGGGGNHATGPSALGGGGGGGGGGGTGGPVVLIGKTTINTGTISSNGGDGGTGGKGGDANSGSGSRNVGGGGGGGGGGGNGGVVCIITQSHTNSGTESVSAGAAGGQGLGGTGSAGSGQGGFSAQPGNAGVVVILLV